MKILLSILFFINYLVANYIDVNKDQSLLEHSYIYIGEKNISKKELSKKLKPSQIKHINIGVNHKYIWIKLYFTNKTKDNIKKLLVFSSPLLENITLFDSNLQIIEQNGMLHQQKSHKTIPYLFELNFKPQSKTSYYLRVSSKYTPIDFSIFLKNRDNFFRQDRYQQFTDILLIGIILAMMLYTLLVSLYLKDKSYLYYSLYLFALIYQQMTYLGITQIYFPSDFISIEAKLTINKILFLILTSALFAMNFLKTNRLPKINFFYKTIIAILILEFIILDPLKEYSLNIVILTGAIFIILNLISGIYAYYNGVKEARLFILGFGIVFFSYIMIIVDALGLVSVMIYFPNILIETTAIEALVLSLAFADRYLILQKEKENSDKLILEELKYREELITQEVIKKTKELNNSLAEKELLLQEVHHRVKNNLQIILSIIRLQTDTTKSKALKEKLHIVENRINAIAKTYSILLSKDNFSTIDMKEYIDELIADLVFIMDKQNIQINKEINMKLPIKESIYIGLIINELVTNSFKYAFDKNRGIIDIKLYTKNNLRFLEIRDNGKGYKIDKHYSSLGLNLVKTIVKNQLKGEITIDSSFNTVSIIKF